MKGREAPFALVSEYSLRKSGYRWPDREGPGARPSEARKPPVLSVPNRGGDDEQRVDILSGDTALSERPHGHDIKTLK